MDETVTIAAHDLSLPPGIAPDLSPEQRQQVLVITSALERDFMETLIPIYAAANEMKIEPLVVATAISLNCLMLAAHLHADNENSFLAMAKQALSLSRTRAEVQ
jgi:hypothetical protein